METTVFVELQILAEYRSGPDFDQRHNSEFPHRLSHVCEEVEF